MEPVQDRRPGPMSVYWPDTMGQRRKHHQQLPAKPHNKERLGVGGVSVVKSVCGNISVMLLLCLLQRESSLLKCLL